MDWWNSPNRVYTVDGTGVITDSTASQALDWTTANQQKIDAGVMKTNLISMNIGKKTIPWEQVKILVLHIMF